MLSHGAPSRYDCEWKAVADPDILFNEMRLNAKGTVGSVGGRKLIWNKIITRKFVFGAGPCPPPPPPRTHTLPLDPPRRVYHSWRSISVLLRISDRMTDAIYNRTNKMCCVRHSSLRLLISAKTNKAFVVSLALPCYTSFSRPSPCD